MGLIKDRRALAAAARMLGSRGEIVRHRSDGTPVIEVGGHELLYRQRDGATYFRLLVLCSVCQRERLTWRGARITSPDQLETTNPGPQICHACAADHAGSSDDPMFLRAKFTHRKL